MMIKEIYDNHSSLCLFENVIVLFDNNIQLYTNDNPHNPLMFSSNNKNKIIYQNNNEDDVFDYFIQDCSVIVSTYVSNNAGHVLGDEVYPVFHALNLLNLNLEETKLNIITDNYYKFTYQFNLLNINSIIQIKNLFRKKIKFKKLILGIEGLGYSSSFCPNYSLNFRYNINKIQEYCAIKYNYDTNIKKNKIIFIDKDINTSEHKSLLFNTDELVNYTKAKLDNKYEVIKVSWKNLNLISQLRLMNSTEIVVSLPGSDLMNCLFLSCNKTIIYFPRLVNKIEKSNEVRIWFHKTHNCIYLDDPQYVHTFKKNKIGYTVVNPVYLSEIILNQLSHLNT
jgi:hypothetical protein